MGHPVDTHVGKRIRHRRWILGMTQQQLAEQLGVKFQQVQKYETGMNRVSASRLWDIANVLSVPVSFFFEGVEGATQAAIAGPAADPMASKEVLDLIRFYHAMPENQQRRLIDLARTLSEAA
jgi:transcriptional regulator with XRE-family HTH domain